MIQKSYRNKLVDLHYITGNKRVKAHESGFYVQAEELSKTEDYLDIVIGEEFNIEWRN